jgi:hypothetical protein
MVKIGGRDIGVDQGLNLYVGAGAIINGLVWLARPDKVHEKTLSETGSKSLTRIGGAAILNMGASHLVAGLSNNPGRNKQHLQVRHLCCVAHLLAIVKLAPSPDAIRFEDDWPLCSAVVCATARRTPWLSPMSSCKATAWLPPMILRYLLWQLTSADCLSPSTLCMCPRALQRKRMVYEWWC